jgi:glutaredoxin
MAAATQTVTPDQAPEYSVFWQPGCSSCARVKEYMTKQGIAFRSVNVADDPGGMDLLRELGARSVPVVARGGKFAFAQSLETVAEFIGHDVTIDRLPPEELFKRWIDILEMAKSLVAHVPEDKWLHKPVSTRNMRFLSWHIFQIPESFLKCVVEGDRDWVTTSMRPVPTGVRTGADIIAYANRIQRDVEHWWETLGDKSCEWPVQTYHGELPAHHFLERQTWHSAQHTRQLGVALADLGVADAPRIPPQLFAGLPMPEAVW